MTILELTRLLSKQDDRWGAILTRAQSTKHPAAAAGIAFFRKTWRPFMGTYYEDVVARYDSAAEAPERVVRWVLDTMASVVFPAAREVGFSERSFVVPDITIDPAIAPTIATVGAEAPRGDEVGVGTKIAFAALALAGVGLAVYARDMRRLARVA